MGTRSRLEGIEVPAIDTDKINWFQVSIPPTSPLSTTSIPAVLPPLPQPSASLTVDYASYSIIGNPSTYLI
ncbi:unnamed protein product, partial [Ilex paraguariensis]